MRFATRFALFCLALAACDKPDVPADKPAASAAPTQTAPPPAPAPLPTPSASPAPAAATADTPTKDAIVSVRDPSAEPEKTAKVIAGGTVSVYLPEWAGTSWKVAQPDKALGKPKEETIPGFAGPTTPAHAFTWQIKDALKGQTHKVVLTNAAKGAAATKTFGLTIDAS
jgi:hypothetical protein